MAFWNQRFTKYAEVWTQVWVIRKSFVIKYVGMAYRGGGVGTEK
jgi:hypothetical protein